MEGEFLSPDGRLMHLQSHPGLLQPSLFGERFSKRRGGFWDRTLSKFLT